MKYRKLANTGTSVSNLALGAMDFGSKTNVDQLSSAQQSIGFVIRILDKAFRKEVPKDQITLLGVECTLIRR